MATIAEAAGADAGRAATGRGLPSALAKAFDELNVGVLICTSEGDLANAELRRIWRAPAGAVIDRRTVERTLRLLDRAAGRHALRTRGVVFRPVRAGLAGRSVASTRAHVDRYDGSRAVVRVAVRPFAADGLPGAVLTVTDETAAHDIERLRDAFLGIVGHELRSPISSILGAAELLRSGRLSEPLQAEILEGLGDEALRLNALVEHLIRLADIERRGVESSDEPVHLLHLARRIVERRRQVLPRLDLALDVRAEMLPPVTGEDGYVGQVLDILLDNAVKYAGAAARVRVMLEPVDGEVVVHVLDDGPGIPIGQADAIFGLFQRAAAPIDDGAAPPGHGIGLFVARSIVQAMGGRMWAANRPSRGADVAFALPVAVE